MSGFALKRLKVVWLATLKVRDPGELRDIQIELLAHGQDGDLLLRRLLAVGSARPAPLVPRELPLAIIDCDDDPLLPQATRQRLIERYPHARHLQLKAGGRYPQITNAATYTGFVESVLTSSAAPLNRQ
ncbi:MAG TPA: hypothetical protein VJY34_17065 [Roseiarcus sp.]|nr:hypothetical protein [Roseiarcus sp.]